MTETLYQWAGGEEPILRLMDCFYDGVERDERLSPYFAELGSGFEYVRA